MIALGDAIAVAVPAVALWASGTPAEDAAAIGRVQEGDLLLLVGFGAGMTAASAVLRWGGVSA